MAEYEFAQDFRDGVLKLDTLPEKIDLWGYNDQIITISHKDADASDVALSTIEIISQNFATIRLAVQKFTTKISKLVLRNCVISDWDKTTSTELEMINYSQVPIPQTPAGCIVKQRVEEDPDDKIIRKKLTGMCITPGSGEQIYGAAARTSLDDMLKLFPNIKQISPVVCGFATSEDLGNCKIKPGVENRAGAPWNSGAYDRTTAHLIGRNNGVVNYGGTPPDSDLVSYLDYAKSKGLEIMLTPMLMVDTNDKPWRGNICGNVADAIKWFDNEYKPWLLNYAHLVKERVDSFLIGSELKKLTSIDDESRSFPIVDKLIELAREVKGILGLNVKVSYGADWSEYHHNGGNYRHLDKLWTSPFIDFVGISAYFPITHTIKSRVTLSELISQWRSGHAYNFWVDGEGNEHSMPSQWGYKSVEEWANTRHYFDSQKEPFTEWKPKMKPVIFTEFGCSSIDKGPNAPNVFYSTTGTFSGQIPYSTGKPDNRIQKLYIRSALEAWENNIVVQGMYYWSFDARGLDWYKDPYWADRSVYPYSHSLEGKVVGNAIR